MILDKKLGQHMLFLDGVYVADGTNPPVFRRVAGPKANDLQDLAEQIAARVGQVLERRGLVERDIENAWLTVPPRLQGLEGDANQLGMRR